jgi:predicted kinase
MADSTENKAKLLVFFGMTAAGKSFLATHWARKNGCPHHNTDVVRKELAGIAASSRQSSGIGKGIYSSEFSARTYNELISRAKEDLTGLPAGTVVVDGSYARIEDRDALVKAFKDEVDIYFIYCHCEDSVVKERLEMRASDPEAVSDGRWEIFLMQKKTFVAPRAIENAKLLCLDTNRPIEKLLADVDGFIN